MKMEGTKIKTMWFLIDYRDYRGKQIEEHQDYPPFGEWSSCSRGYASKEELIDSEGVPLEPCKECGQLFSTNYIDSWKKKLLDHNLCHSCMFWTDHITDLANNPDTIMVVDHNWYSIANEDMKGPKQFRGFGGHKWTFRRLSDQKIFISTNVWYGGEIPKHFQDRIPNTAIVIHGEQMEKV